MYTDAQDSLEQQLRSLYEEREYLTDRFGVSSAEEIVTLVENLEAQLKDFYGRYGDVDTEDDETGLLLSKLKQLSASLDAIYTNKSVHLVIEGSKPVLRAEWSGAVHNH